MNSVCRTDVQNVEAEQVFPGVWRLRFGTPETITPVSVRKSEPRVATLEAMEAPGFPLDLFSIEARSSSRSFTISLPHSPPEGIFGFGLQLKSHLQSGKKRVLRVNSDPSLDQGDSHAPVPFFVSTKGYAVFVDSARYVTFYTGTHARIEDLDARIRQKSGDVPKDVQTLYSGSAFGRRTIIDVPVARGADVYVFGGPTPLEAVQRYVLFSGGGCLPPLWALGNWYRAYTEHTSGDVIELVRRFQEEEMPFSVVGLEPGWQSRFYPNSFVWSDRFPSPHRFAQELSELGCRLNLWENAFVHPKAPFADAIRPFCGDEPSTDGLVPDFLTPEAAEIFARHHREELLPSGAAGFKLDECDNSDFQTFSWSFPEYSQFPSGADGEQMHSLYGVHYQHVVDSIHRSAGMRHFGLARSSGALAAPLPFALYTDLYGFDEFVRGSVNAGTSGLLWSAEVRDAGSGEELIRRVQLAVFSSISMINAWYIPMPPWMQVDRERNLAGEIMDDSGSVQAIIRKFLMLRLRLLPYLQTAFAAYSSRGIPPFRATFFEALDEPEAWIADDQFLFGPSLLVAPMRPGENSRSVFLPKGEWWSLDGRQSWIGGQRISIEGVPLHAVPVFVRSGSILPVARDPLAVIGSNPLPIAFCSYGTGDSHAELFEDALTDDQQGGWWHQISKSAGSSEVTVRSQSNGRFVFDPTVRSPGEVGLV